MNFKQFIVFLHYITQRDYRFFQPLFKYYANVEEEIKTVEEWLDIPIVMKEKEEWIERAQQFSIEAYERQLEEAHIQVIAYTHPLYPPFLRHTFDPPALLYAQGDVSLLTSAMIGIIGSRKATSYSAEGIRTLMPILADERYTVVSGMAQGADAMAHEEAIRQKVRTIAVLGHGMYNTYPKHHRALQRHLQSHELIISEYPPSMQPRRWMFPKRNRIIAGMSESIIVTEAEIKSGTMSTVDYALSHGRTIFAYPGPFTNPLHEGPNALIEQGAIPVISPTQFQEMLRKEREINRGIYNNG